jgi:ATP-dependent Clp protease ATP-binding subunit ClpA
LQILDDGRLTDGRGRTVNFKNTIIILTSNLGSEVYREEKNPEKRHTEIMELVKKFFRPEFINRLDSIVFFNSLNNEMMEKIVNLQLKDVEDRLKKQNLHLEVTEHLKKYLLMTGFDEVYGARPLKRTINELIVDEVALQIVEGIVKPGDKVVADYKQNKVVISVKKPN